MGHAEMNQITDTPDKIYLTSGQDPQTFQEIKRSEVTDPYWTILPIRLQQDKWTKKLKSKRI